ncbi:unnamed protein product [Owenia fusiformis]|uniref:Uncharacterized protein n=1 Tax=Owenia fusiformis TaxID=6347 RepID=A0A8J1XG52_OWEFU|nr:unnamed protein product [Owenia fusiformis]
MSDKVSPQKHQPHIRDLSLIWMRKIMTFIDLQDIDKDGVIGYNDLMLLADRFGKLVKSEKSKNEHIEIHRKRHKILNESSEGPMTFKKQILKYWQLMDDPAIVEQWQKESSGFFKILDSKGNGYLSFDDFIVYWRVLGMDTRFARMQFDYVNTNQDGLITEEEFVKARVEYFTNTDPNNQNQDPLSIEYFPYSFEISLKSCFKLDFRRSEFLTT